MKTPFLSSVVLFIALAIFTRGVAAEVRPAAVNSAAREIDAFLAQAWQQHNVKPNAPASDETFVRRIHLDLVGRIPTHDETVAFLNSTEPDKRAKLIDRLLASEGFTLHQFQFYADILRVLTKGTYPGDAGRVTGTAYAEYIKESIRSNKPYDQLARELVSAQGKVWENGAVGYYQRDRAMPLDNMATTIRIFMGTRIECAQCHDHPFDRWTQMQFHQMAAYTYGVQTVMGIYSKSFSGLLGLQMERRKRTGASPDSEVHFRQALNEMIVPIKHAWVSHAPAQLKLPHDYQYKDAKPESVVKATTLMGPPAEFSLKGKPLESFAAWLTSPENPRFATTIANRLWKKLFGLGVIEPVDDITDNTVPMNPELMDHLRKLMVTQGHDVKAFLRVLCNTQAYQRDVTHAEIALGETYHFTGPLLRRMSAEQMWDSLATLVHTQPDLPNLPLREATDTFIANARKLGEAIEHLSPEELFQRADITSEVFRAHATRYKELQELIAAARKREDKATAAVLGREMGELRKIQIKTADENIYVPAVMKLSPQSRQTGTTYKDIVVPGYKPRDRSAEKAAQASAFLAEAARFGIPSQQQPIYVQHRQNMMHLWPRAAELESPAPIGHPLREFGQSDRESVENANHDASVPQVLVLMNGEIMPSILNMWSQVRLAVKRAPYPDDRIDAVYLSVLSRRATAEEKAKWTQAQGTGLDNIDDIIYALLNTQQFIFIQ